jgi:hypothetical protein
VKSVRLICGLVFGFIIAGCATITPPRNDVARLLAHPQAASAAVAAPDFTADALNTVARLDHELSTLSAK